MQLRTRKIIGLFSVLVVIALLSYFYISNPPQVAELPPGLEQDSNLKGELSDIHENFISVDNGEWNYKRTGLDLEENDLCADEQIQLTQGLRFYTVQRDIDALDLVANISTSAESIAMFHYSDQQWDMMPRAVFRENNSESVSRAQELNLAELRNKEFDRGDVVAIFSKEQANAKCLENASEPTVTMDDLENVEGWVQVSCSDNSVADCLETVSTKVQHVWQHTGEVSFGNYVEDHQFYSLEDGSNLLWVKLEEDSNPDAGLADLVTVSAENPELLTVPEGEMQFTLTLADSHTWNENEIDTDTVKMFLTETSEDVTLDIATAYENLDPNPYSLSYEVDGQDLNVTLAVSLGHDVNQNDREILRIYRVDVGVAPKTISELSNNSETYNVGNFNLEYVVEDPEFDAPVTVAPAEIIVPDAGTGQGVIELTLTDDSFSWLDLASINQIHENHKAVDVCVVDGDRCERNRDEITFEFAAPVGNQIKVAVNFSENFDPNRIEVDSVMARVMVNPAIYGGEENPRDINRDTDQVGQVLLQIDPEFLAQEAEDEPELASIEFSPAEIAVPTEDRNQVAINITSEQVWLSQDELDNLPDFPVELEITFEGQTDTIDDDNIQVTRVDDKEIQVSFVDFNASDNTFEDITFDGVLKVHPTAYGFDTDEYQEIGSVEFTYLALEDEVVNLVQDDLIVMDSGDDLLSAFTLNLANSLDKLAPNAVIIDLPNDYEWERGNPNENLVIFSNNFSGIWDVSQSTTVDRPGNSLQNRPQSRLFIINMHEVAEEITVPNPTISILIPAGRIADYNGADIAIEIPVTVVE